MGRAKWKLTLRSYQDHSCNEGNVLQLMELVANIFRAPILPKVKLFTNTKFLARLEREEEFRLKE